MDSWTFLVLLFTICAPYIRAQQDPQSPCSLVADLDSKARTVSRRLTESDEGLCDMNLAEGWYRFVLAGRTAQIPTQCIRNKLCGTEIPYWLDLGEEGQLPAPGNETTGFYCASYDVLGTVDCCVLRLPARVYNCGNEDYVYYLSPTDRCPVSYCAQDTSVVLDPAYITERGRNASELQELSAASTNATGVSDQPTDVPISDPLGLSTLTVDGTSNPSESDPQPTSAPTSAPTDLIGPLNIEGTNEPTKSTDTPGTGSASPQGESLSNDTDILQTTAPDTQDSSPNPNTTEQVVDVLNNTAPSSAPGTSDQPRNTSGLSVSDLGITVSESTDAPTASSASTADVYPDAPETSGKTIFISETPVYRSSNPQSSDGTELPTDSTKVTFISNVSTPEPTPVRSSGGETSQPPGSDQPTAKVADQSSTSAPLTQPPLTTREPVQPVSVSVTNQTAPTGTDSGVAPDAPLSPTAPEASDSVTTENKVATTESTNAVTSDSLDDSSAQASTPAQSSKPKTPDSRGYINLKFTGKKITSERVRQALIKAVLRRCGLGLDTASPAVRQVFLKYRLCEGRGRTKRQSDDAGGLNPVVTGAYTDKSGTFHANVALAKSNGTDDSVLPAQDLLTILEDEEIHSAFLTELGVDEAEVCSQEGNCSLLTISNETAPQQTRDDDSGVFQSYLGLFIAMIVIGSLCLIIIIFALIYVRCRSHRGSWRNDYSSPERSRLNGRGKKQGAVENPISDEEMMKNEGEMREKDNHQTSENGGHGNYPDEDNGWVVPFDELTPEERALPGLSDTKL